MWLKNLLTGPDGDSYSVNKTGALLLLIVCLGIMVAITVRLIIARGTLISDWALILQAFSLFIPAFVGSVIALVTLQSSNEGGVLKAHGIPPATDPPEKQS